MSQINAQNDPRVAAAIDRVQHDNESFFYKYRWCIVLILALLLAWCLFANRKPEGYQPATITNYPDTSVIPNDAFKYGGAAITGIPTDARNLFGNYLN